MQIFLRVLLALFTPASDAEAEGLHRFAPNDVTVVDAYAHVWSARVAAEFYAVDMDMILAIGFHESRFAENTVTAESGGRVSCGAMTPYPTSSCAVKPLLGQYLDGARHWAVDWRRAGDVRSEREALLGYAGGYSLIRRCRRGPVLRHAAWGDDLCLTPEVFGRIRSRIRSARQAVLAPRT